MQTNGKNAAPSGYASGRYAVGTSCFTIHDKGRKAVVGGGSEDRRIAVRMYYPADRGAVVGKPFAPLFSQAGKAAVMKAFYIVSMDGGRDHAEFYENVPVSQEEKFPLIMYSMGYNSYAECNTYLLCALASRGYIIASVGHAHEAVRNEYDDGTYDVFDPRIKKAMYTSIFRAALAQGRLTKGKLSPAEALTAFEEFQNKYSPYLKARTAEWVKDMEKAHDAVRERYADCIDTRRGTGACGHSLGGCTAYHLCRYNSEFSCGINIDGALFGEFPENTMEKPFCQISCRQNINFETRSLLQTNADTYHVIFRKTAHIGFTDLKFLVPYKFMVGRIDPEELFRNLLYCHTAFFDRYLKGSDTPFEGLHSDCVEYRRIFTR